MDSIVIDVEIQRTIESLPGGWDDTQNMGVATCVVWEDQTGRFRVFGPGQEQELQERVLKADRVSGFNIANFDYPVIFGVAKRDWNPTHPTRTQLIPKTNDILRRIWLGLGLNPDQFNPRTHGGYKLDDMVRDTLREPGKIANGAQAPVWFQEGKLSLVIDYCLDDVRLERNLTKFVDKFGYVVRAGRVIPLGKEGV